ncbi:MAG TPA: ATP-binding cassette domain-containing protein [Catenuloplanes sp.]|jgi:ABC-2 type transport system ATP-binding protein
MPVLTADGVGLRGRRGWLVRDVELRIGSGEIVVITGPPGSGRTSLLLALADRFRLNAGRVIHAGTVALGHVAGVHEPDPALTVAEHVRERLLLLGRPLAHASTVLHEDAFDLDPRLTGAQLTPYQRQLLGLALARLSFPRLIALDGIDVGLDPDEQEALWAVLGARAAAGTAFLATSRALAGDRPATAYPIGDQR